MRLQKPESFYFKFFTLKKSPNSLGHLRVGIVISTKVAKSSVERHRIKRQIMEAIRVNWDLNSSYDVIIIVLPSIDQLENKNIQEIVKNASF